MAAMQAKGIDPGAADLTSTPTNAEAYAALAAQQRRAVGEVRQEAASAAGRGPLAGSAGARGAQLGSLGLRRGRDHPYDASSAFTFEHVAAIVAASSRTC